MTIQSQEAAMGRFSVEVELASLKDILLAEDGHVPLEHVRRIVVGGVVGTGARRLVIPESVATALELPISGQVSVRYADGRTISRPLARNIHLTYGGREGVFSAVVEPDRDSAIVGDMVLEDLDLLADHANGRLVPRDPDRIISEA